MLDRPEPYITIPTYLAPWLWCAQQYNGTFGTNRSIMGIKFLLLPIAAAVFTLPGHQGTRIEKNPPARHVEVRSLIYTWNGTTLTNSECLEFSIEEPELEEVMATLRELEAKMQALQQERMRILEHMIQLKEDLAREVPPAPLPLPPPSPTILSLPDLPVACGSLAVPVRLERSSGTARG
jgi:hypothetical protein